MSTISYAWIIRELERQTEDGYVFKAHWRLEATDDVYYESATGTASFQRPDELIPFDALSKEQVISWVQDSYGEEKIAEVKLQLEARLSQKRNPTQAYGMPVAWDTDDSVNES